jgi:cation diffusion facilitator CzcD-associated flavoprotein CzcO
MSSNGSKAVDHEVAVVGAGLTGICAGIKLGEAGIDFALIERAGDIGGTWRDCTYPGIAVDVPSAHYSLSFEPNPEWSRTYAPGNELKAYADRLVDKYGLRPKIRLNTNVERAVWDEEHHVWELHTNDGVIRARFVISGSGALTDPKVPDIEGVEEFTGKILHTARWDHDHSLDGERIALIGTGASAVQVLPSIAPIVQHISVFQRTPIWVFPRADYAIPPAVKTLFRRVPVTQLALRAVAAVISDGVLWFGVVHNKRLPFLTQRAERNGRAFIRQQVTDPEVAERLTPRYGLGCKRPGVSNDYLRTFNRENVELVSDTIERVTADGIQTVDGTHREIDTLVLATGYKVFDYGNIPGFPLHGVDGIELSEFWRENRHQAYEGTSIPGFPNFFLTFGPYSTTSLSFLAGSEAGVRHAVRAITAARERGATSVEVSKEANDRYFQSVLSRMGGTAFFNNHCENANSYYFDARGDAPGLRPNTSVETWWRSGHYPLEHYAFRTVGSTSPSRVAEPA